MSKRESICENCEKIFTHKNDRSGKFCSQACHYGSKRESINCNRCGKEFKKRKKDPRKTCSKACFMICRGIKTKDPAIREFYHIQRSKKAGQLSFLGRIFAKVRRALNELFTSKS